MRQNDRLAAAQSLFQTLSISAALMLCLIFLLLTLGNEWDFPQSAPSTLPSDQSEYSWTLIRQGNLPGLFSRRV
ncbi:hypothetical protein ACUXQ2_005889 [Cupriavidus metallidurans]